MNKKNLVIVVVLVLIAAVIWVIAVNTYEGRLYAAGVSLDLEDNNTSMIEEILDNNLPVSYTMQNKDRIRHYAVIPSSEFDSLKETLRDNEGIGIIAVKQEDEDIYAFISLLDDTHADTNKLQEHLDKYSLEVKEVNRMYVRFEKDVQYREIEHTLDLLKKENNVISAYPDLLEG
ncbi:MAG: hypothetical protein ACP5E9_09385 [Candidatus Methanospirareceae archaeon]